MKNLLKLFRLDFLPRSTDLALLVLRLWLGLSLVLLHGRAKLANFADMSQKFPDPFGAGPTVSLALAVFAEVFCSLLLVLGLFTRFAALCEMVLLGVAFSLVHRTALQGPQSGELAFIYLAGFVMLFLAGGGRFTLDSKLGGKASASS